MKAPKWGVATQPAPQPPSALQVWIAASMLRLETRDTVPVVPEQWEELW